MIKSPKEGDESIRTAGEQSADQNQECTDILSASDFVVLFYAEQTDRQRRSLFALKRHQLTRNNEFVLEESGR